MTNALFADLRLKCPHLTGHNVVWIFASGRQRTFYLHLLTSAGRDRFEHGMATTDRAYEGGRATPQEPQDKQESAAADAHNPRVPQRCCGRACRSGGRDNLAFQTRCSAGLWR